MSKILEYIKNYRIGFFPVVAIIFAFSGTLYSVTNKNNELAKLIKEHEVSTTIGIPGNYIALKNIFCLPELPELHKQELSRILKQYELELHALLYNKQVSDNHIETTEYALQYISAKCKNAT